MRRFLISTSPPVLLFRRFPTSLSDRRGLRRRPSFLRRPRRPQQHPSSYINKCVLCAYVNIHALRHWVYSRNKRPLSVRDPVRHLAVEGLLNFLHNALSSGRFDMLTNPVDASRESCRQRANFDCIPSAEEEPIVSASRAAFFLRFPHSA